MARSASARHARRAGTAPEGVPDAAGGVELSLALHRTFDRPADVILWDSADPADVHRVVSGDRRAAENGADRAGTRHRATVLSCAHGLATARDLRRDDSGRVVAVVGEGSMIAGSTYEGLNNLGHGGRRVVVVLDDRRSRAQSGQQTGNRDANRARDHGSPTGSRLAGSLARLRSVPAYVRHRDRAQRLLQAVPGIGRHLRRGLEGVRAGLRDVVEERAGFFDALGVRYVGPVDGNDIVALERSLAQAAAHDGPVIVHAITENGRRQRSAPDVDHHHHDHDHDHDYDDYEQAFSDALVEVGERDPRLVVVAAGRDDTSRLRSFADRWPDRFLDVGPAHQHAITAAAGLAMAGLRPVVAIHSARLGLALDQLNLDVGLHRLPVVVCVDHAGVTGDDGPCGHGVLDLALLSLVPGITVLAPSSAQELRVMLVDAARMEHGPVAIRHPAGAARQVGPDDVGSGLAARRLAQGHQVCILAVGALVGPALDAASLLAGEGVAATVWDVRATKPLDETMLADAAGHGVVVTVEDGIAQGGAGAAVADALGACRVPVVIRGVPDRYLPTGSRPDLLAALGLDGPGIAAAALSAWRRHQRPTVLRATVPRGGGGAAARADLRARAGSSEVAALAASPSTPLLSVAERRTRHGTGNERLGPLGWSVGRPRPPGSADGAGP